MLKFFRIITVAFLILWMSFIFCFSAQTADKSTKTSDGIVKTVVNIIYRDFEDLEQEKQQEILTNWKFIIRKCAHFTLYAILGFFAFFVFATYNGISLCWRTVLSGAVCLLYAVSDEIHQLYVPGRSGEIRDVLIDFCGSTLMIILLYIVVSKCNFKIAEKYIKRKI